MDTEHQNFSKPIHFCPFGPGLTQPQFRKIEFVMNEMTERTLLNVFHAIVYADFEYLIIL